MGYSWQWSHPYQAEYFRCESKHHSVSYQRPVLLHSLMHYEESQRTHLQVHFTTLVYTGRFLADNWTRHRKLTAYLAKKLTHSRSDCHAFKIMYTSNIIQSIPRNVCRTSSLLWVKNVISVRVEISTVTQLSDKSFPLSFCHNFSPSVNIHRVIKSNQMRWAEHIGSTWEIRNMYKIFIWEPRAKIPFSGLGHRWEDDIKILILYSGIIYLHGHFPFRFIRPCWKAIP
jgi:hypothetical protein